jgi:hypothetical protein
VKQLYIIILLFYSISLSAQKDSVIIDGVITGDSLSLENIHIINLNSKKGTVSNALGQFQIAVKLNDIIFFSGLQFSNKEIKITKLHLERKKIALNLTEKNNELPEVVIENMAVSLGLPNAGKKPLNKLERNLNAYSQKKTPIVILEMLLGKFGGIDDLYNIISGNRKRDRKLKKLLDDDKQRKINQEYILEIRNHFQDNFFLKTLHISKENINGLIGYCLPKGIVPLFKEERYLEIIDILIKNKEEYLLSLK